MMMICINYIISITQKKIMNKDDNALYITQLLLPILNNNKLEGLFICFRTHMNYIDSSIKPIKATRNFVQKILNDNQQHK